MTENDLKRQTKHGLYWQSFNQVLDLGLQFVIGIILARLLSLEDYGITAMPAIFLGIAGIFIDCGFGTALVRKPDLTEKDLSTAFYYGIYVGLFCYLALFGCAGLIADFYNAPILKPVLRVTAIGLFLGPIGSVQNVQLTRNLQFKTQSKLFVVNKVVTGALGLGLAFGGYGIWALVIPPIISQVIGIFLLYYFVRWLPKEKWSRDSFNYLWGFGNKLLLSYLIGVIYENIHVIVIGKFFSASKLGLWNRAQNYANLPSKQATNVLQRVTFPVLSKIQDDEERLRQSYRRILKTSVFVVFPCMMMLSALARPTVLVMVTDKWEGCIYFLQIMCFAVMWYPVHAINLNLLQVKGRSDYFLKLEIIKKIMGVAILCVTIPMGLVAMAYGQIVSSLLSLVINTHYTGKLIDFGIGKQLLDYLPTILMSAAMYFVLRAYIHCVPNIYAQLFGGVILGGCVFLGLAILFKRSELQELKYLLSIKK